MRKSLSVATSAAVALWLALVVGCAPPTTEAQYRDQVRFYDWNWRQSVTGDPDRTPQINQVQLVVPYDERGFSYLTGGDSAIANDRQLKEARTRVAPDRIASTHTEGVVSVYIRASRDDGEDYGPHAEQIAKTIHFATTEIWPGHALPVIVDIHVMPDDVAYSFARTVEWKEGDPFRLATFVRRRGIGAHLETPAHELYHVMAHRWKLGRHSQDVDDRRNEAIAYEEIAAPLFASCGVLLANRTLPRPDRDITLTIDGERVKYPLSRQATHSLLQVLRGSDQNSKSTRPGNLIGSILSDTPVLEVFAVNQEHITFPSPEGDRLIELCRRFAADPMRLETWLTDLG